MYIAGENQETSTQTVAMIEGIIRDQVVYMVRYMPLSLSLHDLTQESCVLQTN